jgi:hypothetical protein
VEEEEGGGKDRGRGGAFQIAYFLTRIVIVFVHVVEQ